MAKANRHSRNIGRKPRSRPNGFVLQDTNSPVGEQRSGLAANKIPEAGSGFVPQNATADAPATQRAATNRANAQHSTGPRTTEGKAASSRNALKHGLSLQRHVILQQEDPADYRRILAELRDIYEPQSRREDLSVEDIAQCRWALQRFDEAEAVALRNQTCPYTNDPEEDPCSVGEALAYIATTHIDFNRRDRDVIKPDTCFPTFEKIQRYRAHWDRRHQRAIAAFDHAQRARRAEDREQRQRAEEARRQAGEQRKQELHELRVALAKEKLLREQTRKNGPAPEGPPPEAAGPGAPGFVSSTRTPFAATHPSEAHFPVHCEAA